MLGIVFVTGVAVSMCTTANNPASQAANTPVPDAAPVAPVAAPINLDDAKALDDRYGSAATSHCDVEADDYLRSVSKLDFKWDDTGFLEQKFDKYVTTVSAPGVLTSVSRKAKLQNGFGAYQRIELFCDYDTQTEKVLAYRLIPQE
jgi:hypothetical protein